VDQAGGFAEHRNGWVFPASGGRVDQGSAFNRARPRLLNEAKGYLRSVLSRYALPTSRSVRRVCPASGSRRGL